MKAGRAQVLAAADEILLSGRRPTIEALKERLNGGSPNSIVNYLREWYAGLGERLQVAGTPPAGLSREVYHAALQLQQTMLQQSREGIVGDTSHTLIQALRAEIHSLQFLKVELRNQLTSQQQSIADVGAILLRKDEELRELQAAHVEALKRLAVLSQRLGFQSSRGLNSRKIIAKKRPTKGTRKPSGSASKSSSRKRKVRRSPRRKI